jgi:hypothetical protein
MTAPDFQHRHLIFACAFGLLAATGCASAVELAQKECVRAGHTPATPTHRECVRRTSARIEAVSNQVEHDTDRRLRDEQWEPAQDPRDRVVPQ